MYSPGAQALQNLFNALPKPYGPGDIIRFNLAYQRAYPNLSRAEQRHAEQLVDVLIADVKERTAAIQGCASD